jgi:hypothetical protein
MPRPNAEAQAILRERAEGSEEKKTTLSEPRWVFVSLDPKGKYKVRARCAGYLAVHSSLRDSRRWVVSSVTTGRLVVSFDNREDAQKAAIYLAEDYGEQFREPNLERMRRILPGWMRAWCDACRVCGYWVDPSIYRD